jgi:ribose/xylose/arabinose/galactoside ABC-type transport system permease subunit
MNLLSVPYFYQLIVKGMVILVAVHAPQVRWYPLGAMLSAGMSQRIQFGVPNDITAA